MVLHLFRKSDGGLDQIANRTVAMLIDARHSFDLAHTALLSGADADTIRDDVHETDSRINHAEQELRGQLVTHLAVHGTLDTAAVLSYLLLIKKIERIGDQVKNILDMTDEGVDLAEAPDHDELAAWRRRISDMFGEVIDLMRDPDPQAAARFREEADARKKEIEQHIRQWMHADEPGHYAVPRAILYRYWKRIVANLGGVVSSITEPLQHQDYYDEGETDIED